MVRFFCYGGQFLFSKKIVNRVFDNVLIDRSGISVDFCIIIGVRKLPQSFFSVEVGPPKNDCAAFFGRSTLISLIILSSLLQFAAFLYI